MAVATVSVLIPTAGQRPEYLAEAVVSAQQQRVDARLEVIVEHDPTHTGQSATVNRAFARCTGEWITVLEDDDFYVREDAVGLLLATARLHPEAAAVYSLPQYVSALGEPVPTPPRLAAWMAAHPRVRWGTFPDGLAMHGSGLLYARTAWDAVGGWDESIPCCEEYEFHLHLLQTGHTFVALPVPIMAYRQHPHQKSGRRNGSGVGRTSARRKAVQEILRRRYDEVTV